MRWLSALIVLVFVQAAMVDAASIRKVYFSSVLIPPGQTVQGEGQLPGATKEFNHETDKVARLYLVFGDVSAHTLAGDVKSADGTVVHRIKQSVPAYMRAGGGSWRYTWHNVPLEKLQPGEYSVDLLIDDASAGTYGFTLK